MNGDDLDPDLSLALHREAEQLVPFDIDIPEMRPIGSHSNVRPARTRQARMAWRLPLIAAALVILLTTGSILLIHSKGSHSTAQSDTSPPLSQVNLTAKSILGSETTAVKSTAKAGITSTMQRGSTTATDSQFPVAQIDSTNPVTSPREMSGDALSQAQKLITEWTRAKTLASSDSFGADSDGSIVSARATTSGDQLEVTFIGSTYKPNEPCGYYYDTNFLEASDVVAVYIFGRTVVPPPTPPKGCTMGGALYTVTIPLKTALGDKTVIDIASGKVVPTS